MLTVDLSKVNEKTSIDRDVWHSMTHASPPESLAAWIRFCSSEKSGFGFDLQIACLQKRSSAAALVLQNDPCCYAADHRVCRAWDQFKSEHPKATGLKCWLPMSIYHGVLHTRGAMGGMLLKELIHWVVDWGNKNNYAYILFPGVAKQEDQLSALLTDRRFFKLPAEPGTVVDFDVKNFKEFISLFNYKKRYNFQKMRQAFKDCDGQIAYCSDVNGYADRCAELHRNVCKKYSSASFLKSSFFKNIKELDGSADLLLFYLGERLVHFTFCLQHNQFYSAKFLGMDYKDTRLACLYPNALYHYVERALDLKCRRIYLGTSAYHEKRLVRCTSVPRSHYMLILNNRFRDYVKFTG